jgi:hypothetical protein
MRGGGSNERRLAWVWFILTLRAFVRGRAFDKGEWLSVVSLAANFGSLRPANLANQ